MIDSSIKKRIRFSLANMLEYNNLLEKVMVDIEESIPDNADELTYANIKVLSNSLEDFCLDFENRAKQLADIFETKIITKKEANYDDVG